jgi:uncharacterized damage-inducible protein DinB
MILLAAAIACAFTLQAQPPSANPLSSEARTAYTQVKNLLLRMADKMPEENYAFKPTPEIRDFGATIAHIADSQMRMCSTVNGEARQLGAASKKTKADLVAALKESFGECDKAFDALTDATATQMVTAGRGQRSKLGMLNYVTAHDNEEYGYLAVYLRLKGIVPPSSEPRQ